MKTLLAFAGSLAFAALLQPAQAQTPAPATTHDNPTPAKPTAKPTTQRGSAYKQAPGTDKAVGRKFVEKSKPTGTPNQPRTPVQ